MKYRKISIFTSPEGIEIVSGALINEGILDIQIDNPRDVLDMIQGLKPTEWYDPDQIPATEEGPAKIMVYTHLDGGEEAAEVAVYRAIGEIEDARDRGDFGEDIDLGTLEVLIEDEDDEEWKDKWKEFFKPTRVSERIIVKPTWQELDGIDVKPSDIVIEIDPGQAFGTGAHETTSLTLKHMEDYLKPGDKILDVGVGSGILAIAAAKLEAEEILGIDIDEEAVRVSEENYRLNHVEDKAGSIKGDLLLGLDDELISWADMVVANLLSNLVIKLTPSVKKYIKPEGIYISSGILTEKEDMVARAIEESGFKIEEIKYDGEWCSIAARLI